MVRKEIARQETARTKPLLPNIDRYLPGQRIGLEDWNFKEFFLRKDSFLRKGEGAQLKCLEVRGPRSSRCTESPTQKALEHPQIGVIGGVETRRIRSVLSIGCLYQLVTLFGFNGYNSEAINSIRGYIVGISG
jgi:hypothetical protein